MSDKPLAVPAWVLTIMAMFSVQLGSALSLPMINDVGAAGTAWLRLTAGALIFLVIARPQLSLVQKKDVLPLLVLGIATGVVTVSFLGAIERLPLGTCISIEFLGPLTVATVRSHNSKAMLWPLLAFAGVLLMTKPWEGTLDFVGVGLALISAVGWGTYIVLTDLVGSRFEGLTGLSLTLPISAVTAAVVGVPSTISHITPQLLLTALGLALLMPVLPYAFEMVSLRHMSQAAFGTFMSLEPAFGVLIGAVVLGQTAGLGQLAGVGLVVLAGVATQRIDQRTAAISHLEVSE